MAMFTETRKKSEASDFAQKDHTKDYRPQEKHFQKEKIGGTRPTLFSYPWFILRHLVFVEAIVT